MWIDRGMDGWFWWGRGGEWRGMDGGWGKRLGFSLGGGGPRGGGQHFPPKFIIKFFQ